MIRYLTFVNVVLDADAVINNSSQKVGGSGPIKHIGSTPLGDRLKGVHPLRSLVTSVLSHFGPRTEVHIHFGL